MQELKICTFDEIEAEDVKWLWKPYIAFGKVTVIQGDPGNGKTTLALAIASLVSRRLPMPTGDAPPFVGNVIYQSGEDGAKDTIKPRLMSCNADCSRIAFVDTEDARLDVEMFEEAIVGTNAKLAVIDPLQSFLTEKQDISSVKYMRPLLRDLGNIAARTGAAIVIIGHMNKADNKKGIYRGLGSIDISAAVRSVLLVGKHKDNKDIRFMAQIKNNLAPIGKAVSFTLGNMGGVEFLGECEISEEDLLSTSVKPKTKYQQAKEMIERMLRQGDRTSNEIHNVCIDAGISPRVISDVKRDYLISSIKKPDDWYWTITGSKWDTTAKEDDESEEMDEVTFVTLDDRPISEMLTTAQSFNPKEPEIVRRPPLELDDDLFEVLPLTSPMRTRGRPPKVMQSPTVMYDDLRIFDWRAQA